MSRGIHAGIWVIAALVTISMLTGLGFYDVTGTSFATPSGDTNKVVERLEEPSGSAASGEGVVESFTVGALDVVQVFWIAISDTSEVVMLFLPFQPIADAAELLARVAMGYTFLQIMRGVVF